MLQIKTVVPATRALLKNIQALPDFKDLRLVGGTALALQLGHRESIDLDFFGVWDLKLDLFKLLSQCGEVEHSTEKKRLQFYKVNGVKCDFVTYEYPWLSSAVEEKGFRLASLEDIAAMKLQTVTSRGRVKDYIDIAELLNHFTLHEMMGFFVKKFHDGTPLLVFRSLMWFKDAEEDDEMPVMLKRMNWEEIKSRIMQAAASTMREWI